MADLSRTWLEVQLLREMAQVKAPDTLWAQIQTQRRARHAQPRRNWMLWPVIATMLLLASGDLFWEVGKARGSRIQSSNPAEVRAWVKARTNMDVDVTCGGGNVLLSGARLIEMKDQLVAEISYKLGGKSGRMLIARAAQGAPEIRLDAPCIGCHTEGHRQL